VRGETRLAEEKVDAKPGERVLFCGEPGSGKSTFFLAIAGLWDWGSGLISLPPDSDIMFLPQRPFVPAGTLRVAMTRSDDPKPKNDEELKAALERVGLGRLTQSLDRFERWDVELSGRDQQRLVLARALADHPKWVVSDEGLDFSDDSIREIIESIFGRELAETGIIATGSSSVHNNFYGRVIKLIATPHDDSADAKGAPAQAGGSALA
jgi:putative ATP-binding cassette transporter